MEPADGAGALSSGIALLQLLYLATQRIIEKWKMPVLNRKLTVGMIRELENVLDISASVLVRNYQLVK